jgi:tetratricopeptide (TPR) repeat protein
LEKLGDRDAAQKYYKETIPAYYKLLERESTIPHIEGLASANSSYAKFVEGSKDYVGAQNAYERAIQLYGKLAGSKSWTSRSDYALAHNNYGVLLMNRQKLPEAREHYEEALKICSTYGYHELHVEVLNNFAMLLEITPSFAEAENRYNDAIKLCEKHLEEQPDAFGLKKAKALVGCAHVKLVEASKGSSKSHLRDAASYLARARATLSLLPPSDEEVKKVAESERALRQHLDGATR